MMIAEQIIKSCSLVRMMVVLSSIMMCFIVKLSFSHWNRIHFSIYRYCADVQHVSIFCRFVGWKLNTVHKNPPLDSKQGILFL